MRKLMPLLVLALAAGCSSKDADLRRFIEQTKQEQPSGVEPLPETRTVPPLDVCPVAVAAVVLTEKLPKPSTPKSTRLCSAPSALV